MPLLGRRRRPLLASANPDRSGHNALTASGYRVTRSDADALRRLIQPWQTRAFAYYDLLGEIKYAAQFYARGLAPLKLYAAEVKDTADGDTELVPTDNEVAIAALERIQDPGGGRTGLLSSYGRLMFLAGESYLFVTEDKESGLEQWEFLSTDELRVDGSGTYVRYKAPSLMAEDFREPKEDDWKPIGDDKTAVAYRVWQRHPRYSMLADSTMQGVLDLCEELVLLTHAVRARARSRLAGNGILWIDDAISSAPLQPLGDEDLLNDPFLADLTQAMTTPIIDEGSAGAVVPLITRVTVPDGKKLQDLAYHMTLIDPMQLYPETGLRTECIDRIAIGLDMPPEILKGLQDSNHWCVDDRTEILTADGWKLHGDLCEGDETLTLNHETGMSEWQPVEHVARFDVEDLPMLSVESRFHSSLTTMNHRWPVLRLAGREGSWERAWTHSDELRTTHRLVTAAPSRNALMPQWVQHDDALVELVAWLWTEGQIRERAGRDVPQVAIYQSHSANPENVLRIRCALTSLYGVAASVPMRGGRGSAIDHDPRWRERRTGDKTTFVLNAAAASRLLDHVGTDRVVSTDFVRTLTASQLALFIEVSTLADGSTMKSGCQIIGQKDAARLAPLELAAILLGRSPSSYSQTHDGFAVHEQHYVSVSRRQTVRLRREHIKEERYTGVVWCPVTGNSTWCARRNGRVFFTGNTAWQIDEQTWKGHLQPKAQQLCDDLTAAYFRPQLQADGVEDFARYVIAYDATDVINHPDRSGDAQKLYDRRAIGKAALRKANGFDDSDAPTEDERAEMVGVATRDSSLAWFGTPSPRGGNVEVAPGDIEAANPGGVVDAGTNETGASVEAGPPPEPQSPAPLTASAHQLLVARTLGAAEFALIRAREVAGNRLRSKAKADSSVYDEVRTLQASRVAHGVGAERTEALGVTAQQLVAGTAQTTVEALRTQGMKNQEVAGQIAERVEQHAARTLFDETSALPATFVHFVTGITRA